MEKEQADKIITEYMKKIYGFAYSKTMDIDLAEELASRIVMEIYTSLLKADNVKNIVSYVYRIACNTHSRFVMEEKSIKQMQIQKITEPKYHEHDKAKIYDKIRKEIAYLSSTQREIIIMFYYQKMKIKDIAQKLNLSVFNTKNQLYLIRNTIKDGLNQPKSNHNHKNIVFLKMFQRGKMGLQGRRCEEYFTRNLSQNISFSTYIKPKTPVEIAKELSVPVAYIEDELQVLKEYGFINKVGEQKYQTNIFITNYNKETQESIKDIFMQYAKLYCDLYIPLLIQNFETIFQNAQIYVPENDRNFLMWALTAYSNGVEVTFDIATDDLLYNHYTKRIDGSHSIVFAHVSDDFNNKIKTSNDRKKSKENTDFTAIISNFSKELKAAWIHFSKYDDREVNLFHKLCNWIFSTLYDFMVGKLKKDPQNINNFMHLYESGFIVSKADCQSDPERSEAEESTSDFVNLIVTTLSPKDFKALIPPIPDILIKINKEFETKLYHLTKNHFPPPMQELNKLMCHSTSFPINTRVFVLDHLLKTSILKPLKKHQKKTVNMILFTDVLPEK